MRVHLKLPNGKKYATEIMGAEASWTNREERKSEITLYGNFPFEDVFYHRFTIKFRTEIGLSLCKKLEKEGMADLATDYVRGFITEEYFEDDSADS